MKYDFFQVNVGKLGSGSSFIRNRYKTYTKACSFASCSSEGCWARVYGFCAVMCGMKKRFAIYEVALFQNGSLVRYEDGDLYPEEK